MSSTVPPTSVPPSSSSAVPVSTPSSGGSTASLPSMEQLIPLLSRMQAQLDAQERRLSAASIPRRPDPDPPYGMPFGWSSSMWMPGLEQPMGSSLPTLPTAATTMTIPSMPPLASTVYSAPVSSVPAASHAFSSLHYSTAFSAYSAGPSHSSGPQSGAPSSAPLYSAPPLSDFPHRSLPSLHPSVRPLFRGPPQIRLPTAWDIPHSRATVEYSPQFQSSAWDNPASRTPASPQSFDPARHIKMDPPLFDGSDVSSWIARIQYYFDHISLPEVHRLHYVVMLFSPPASDWVFSYRANNPSATWAEFLEDVRRRFDPNYFVNYIELLAKLTQTGSLAEYNKEFEHMLNHISGLPESTLLPIYIGGLAQSLKNQVRFQHPRTLASAMALAIEFDSVTARPLPQRRPWSTKDSGRSSAPISSATISSSTASKPKDLSKLPIVRVSGAERAERSRLGLCWYCPDKWVPGHVCNKSFLVYMGVEDEEEQREELQSAESLESEVITADISHMYAMDGRQRSDSIQLRGMIGSSEVTVLVDTGSTHDFLHPRVAERLQLPLKAVRLSECTSEMANHYSVPLQPFARVW